MNTNKNGQWNDIFKNSKQGKIKWGIQNLKELLKLSTFKEKWEKTCKTCIAPEYRETKWKGGKVFPLRREKWGKCEQKLLKM